MAKEAKKINNPLDPKEIELSELLECTTDEVGPVSSKLWGYEKLVDHLGLSQFGLRKGSCPGPGAMHWTTRRCDQSPVDPCACVGSWCMHSFIGGVSPRDDLTHCGLVQLEILVNTGSGNGLVPEGTKPLPEPMLTYHQRDPVTFNPR